MFPQLEILELIGQGGMGSVYKARQPALDRLVALKLLPAQTGTDPGFAERFSQEARALAHLSHPNIVAIYDFGTAGGMNYFLMEFVDGVNLRQLQRSDRVSPRDALQIVPQICDALQSAHDEGIVHRDIKPENVLVDRKGRVKIADFGLAKILGRETPDFRLTREGQVMGTPHYMAPEQVEHPLAVDHRADIYALGVVFYEMLTGELPLGRFQPPSRKVEVDVRLDEVVLHALEKEPERRYQHASEVKTAVETIAQTSVPKAKNEPSKLWGGVSMFNNGHIRVGISLAVAGLLLIGVLRYTIFRSHLPQEAVQNPDAETPVLATAAYNGDFAVRLVCLGSVDSSNSVVFSIPDRAVQEVVKRFDAGQLLTVEAEDRDGKTFGHGSLRGVDNQIDTATGTLKCTATLVPEGDHLMLRGLFLNIHLTLEVKHGVTLVPAEAIRRDAQGPFVWAIKPDQTVSRRPVQVGTIDKAKVEIQSVLPGELVVIGPANDNLHEGQTIPYKLVHSGSVSHQESRQQTQSASATRAAGVANSATEAALGARASLFQVRLVARDGSAEPADLLSNSSGSGQLRVLRPVLLDGSAVARAGIRYLVGLGVPGERQIQVQFNTAGTRQFEAITATNINRQLAILYQGRLISTLVIHEPLLSDNLAINADELSAEDTHAIVDVLNHTPFPTINHWTFTEPREVTLLALLSPVTEPSQLMVVPLDTSRGWLDLDSGMLVTNKSVREETRDGRDWIRNNGFDLVAAVSSRQSQVLTALDMVKAPAPLDGWSSITPADVAQNWALMQMEPSLASQLVAGPGGLTDCYLFQTREGGKGILQILGLAADGRSVRLRYKLATQSNKK
ncbi:MAG: protein kinase [Verrucomicrobiota bacterium]